ncbi:MAG: 2-hydroxyglutaryl-CoA dehydratase, partial [Dehalococcoidales bacterium]|nr:2-hydroxyglutaryl-CoA dehydratase [Dehalococcoidales bacterium]
LSMKATSPVRFNTGCAVFAETEAISRVAEGETIEDILAGVNNALASKIGSLIERMGAEQDIVLTGGGAKDEGLVRSLQGLLGVAIFVPDEPQIVAAMGAAVTHSYKRS